MEAFKDKLSRQIAGVEQQFKALCAIRDLVNAGMPEDQLAALFSEGVAHGSATGDRRGQAGRKPGPRPGNFEKVAEFFRGTGNEWATIKEIVDGTGMTKPGVRQILYVSQPGKFDRESGAGARRQTKFRLKGSG